MSISGELFYYAMWLFLPSQVWIIVFLIAFLLTALRVSPPFPSRPLPFPTTPSFLPFCITNSHVRLPLHNWCRAYNLITKPFQFLHVYVVDLKAVNAWEWAGIGWFRLLVGQFQLLGDHLWPCPEVGISVKPRKARSRSRNLPNAHRSLVLCLPMLLLAAWLFYL